MNILYVLIPVSLALALVGLLLFVWAVRSGQFDDLDTPALRMLHDNDGTPRNRQEAQPPSPQRDAGDGETGEPPAATSDRSADER